MDAPANANNAHVCRAVIVEDDATLLRLLVAACAQAGVSVEATTDANDGAHLVQTHRPDVVSVDLDMRHGSAEELIASIRGSRTTAGIPIVALSHFGLGEEADRAAERKGVTVLPRRELSLHEVVRAIRGACAKSPRD